jgi:1-aminocyclopropane-1-carboxylate deaminase
VSGNKWYKLRYYIQEALGKSINTIASFGGPYSNHLVALAYVAQENKLHSVGFVRANNNEPLTPSLQDAISFGMQLEFIGRTNFQEIKNEMLLQHKVSPEIITHKTKTYFINEGGYGILGAKGAATILNNIGNSFTTIIAAVGTGTMLAGLINGAAQHQQVIGIPVLKNEQTIETEIKALLNNKSTHFSLLHQFHQGGYAKTSPALIEFMNQLWSTEKIPTDIVYTGKLLFAVNELLKENYFKLGSKILLIHSGGLQGNRSMPAGTLLF